MKFVDTSFWYALVDAGDRRHTDAVSLQHQGLGRLVTSHQVVGETWTLLLRRFGHVAAVRFLDGLSRIPDVEVAHIGEPLELLAWRWLRSRDERTYSFVDACSFALMRSRHIREAVAFDGDFAAAGFVEVRPR